MKKPAVIAVALGLLTLLGGGLHGPSRRTLHGRPGVNSASAPDGPTQRTPAASSASGVTSVASSFVRAVDDLAACGLEPSAPPASTAEAEGAPDDPASAPQLPPETPRSARVVATEERIDAALRHSADPYERAVGVWLNVLGHEDEGGRKLALTRMARDTRDPRIYALAFRACDQSAGNGCEQLDVRRWAELDADNGVPWLYLLADAQHRGDVSGVEEAMFRLAASPRFDEHFMAPLGPVVGAVAPGGEAQALDIAVRVVGLSAAQVVPYVALTALCRTDAAAVDANLWQSCHAVASRMASNADTLIARRIGAAVDFRITGDGARRDRRRADLDALAKVASPSQASGCDAVRAGLTFFRGVAAQGEVEALRRMADRQPGP